MKMDKRMYSIGEGWQGLVDPLITICEENGGTVVQVKEKFGGLRFYYDPPKGGWGTPFWVVFGYAVRWAEFMSYRTCEVTGTPGKLRSLSTEGKPKWHRTLCDKVADELGYDTSQEEELS